MKKAFKVLLAAVMVLCMLSFAACGDKKPTTEPEHEHTWVVKTTTAATCGEEGVTVYTCSCGEEKTEKTPATGKHTYSGGVCSECGYIDMSELTEAEAIAAHGFYHVDEDESNTYTNGDTVKFGSYPQRLVGKTDEDNELVVESDAATLAALENFIGTLPTNESNGDWTAYDGYYDNGVESEYAYYRDVELSGTNYRGIYLTKYRPYYSGFAAYDGETEADKNNSVIYQGGFELGEVYWFEYEPISWIVLSYTGGELLLNASICLDSQPFQAQYGGTTSNVIIPGTNTSVNDWEHSTVRDFLNNTFYNVAFGETEQALIQTKTLDNKTTGVKADNEYQINQNNTQDKVYLLSYQDLVNTDYGFTAKASYDNEVQNSDEAKLNNNYDSVPDAMIRRRSYTDYSTSQGLHISVMAHALDGGGACWYLLRSAGTSSFAIAGVNKYGSVIYSRPVDLTGVINNTNPTSEDALAICGNYGILPSVSIKVGK